MEEQFSLAPPERSELASIVHVAVLLFTLPLHDLGRMQSLDGLSIAVEGSILLAPNAFRSPGIAAILAKFPHALRLERCSMRSTTMGLDDANSLMLLSR
ncbi:hypothetical protein [Sinorhizobium chiapasense]|uniref:Uncharacterized protein n=1 Tax=Sinorhizobium chiapasense TaxID=501572 RepID=A0ABZ2BBT6_9HYPH